jgi:hypothetical protein
LIPFILLYHFYYDGEGELVGLGLIVVLAVVGAADFVGVGELVGVGEVVGEVAEGGFIVVTVPRLFNGQEGVIPAHDGGETPIGDEELYDIGSISNPSVPHLSLIIKARKNKIKTAKTPTFSVIFIKEYILLLYKNGFNISYGISSKRIWMERKLIFSSDSNYSV